MVSDLVDSRLATADDLPRTTALGDLARDEVADQRGGRWLLDHDMARVPTAQHHLHALEDVDRCLVVGTIDGVVVGYGLAAVSAAIGADICMIEELVVHPQARAVGVGSHVLATVRDWAIDKQCAAIESQVLPGNRAGKNFFERVGMKTRKMRVSAQL